MTHDAEWDAEREARRRFNEELAARGEPEVTDHELIDVIGLADDDEVDRPGCLARLDTRDFADAVGTVLARRETYGHAPRTRRAVDEKPRTETLTPDSPLAGEGWRAYLAGRQERVLARFALERDDARAQLGLQPLLLVAQTRSAQRAWLGGDRDEQTREVLVPELGDSFEDEEIDEYVAQLGDDTDYGFGYAKAARLWAQGEDLAALAGREEALEWLVSYIAGQAGTGGSQILWWGGTAGETVAVPFPARCYPLRNLRDLAQRVANAAGCPESEATEWLLADVPPEAPETLSIVSYPSTIEWGRVPDGTPFVVPHAERSYVITVASGLVSPDEVRALYRRVRNADYGLPTDPAARQSVWSAELARFVAGERHWSVLSGGQTTIEEIWRRLATQRLPTWEEIWRRWNARYPQKPFTSWRAMRSSYLHATTHAAASDEVDDPKESSR